MPLLPDELATYVIVGSTPDEEPRPFEIFMEPGRADLYVLDGLMNAMLTCRGTVSPGDTISMLVSIGRRPDDGEETMTTGSVAINTDNHRHVWDFRVEKRFAVREPVHG